jgi:putative membrane-bound dehydrogenase-like protein
MLRPRPGFKAELVAAEPLIESPVAFDWGADGRLWVVEMRDYPLGMDNHGKPGGRVVCLQDTRGDGRYDKATVFLDNLLFPSGVMTWGKGVLITCAPDILYAEDTRGTGKADKVEVVLTGFGEANPQHRVNGLRCGLDNWIYCANGDFAPARRLGAVPPSGQRGGGFSPSQAEDLRRLEFAGARVRSPKTEATWDIRNRDFRFRPEDGTLNPQSGQAQFGRDRDDWGNWFGCNNAVPLWHYALDDHYLRRNPHVAAPTARVEAPRSVTFSLGTGRDTGSRRDAHGNAWTSGCSVMVYRDTLFGPDFAENWFTCEPVHNLVHREVLVPAGATFTSGRAADEQAGEFLASSDPMFTPVMIRTGPDGAIWVADMYRKVLEHPHWLPPGWEKAVDVRAGHDRGRIYRVYPADKEPRRWPRLDRLDTAGLVALLDSTNGWLRDKAQQMLVRRRDPAAVAALEEKAQRASALGRLHALCTLDGLGSLKPRVLVRALGDTHPGVRRHAVRLSETAAARVPAVEAALLKRVDDPDPFVLVQLAYTLGTWDTTACGKALGRLLRQRTGDPYLVAAALSSLTGKNLAAVVKAVLASPEDVPPPVTQGLLQSAVGLGAPRAAAALLGRMLQLRSGRYGQAQFAVLADWLDALDQRNTPLAQLARDADRPLGAELQRLAFIFQAARRSAHDRKAPLAERIEAMRLLGRGPDRAREDQATLAGLLGPQNPEELQAAAVSALGRLADPDALLKEWKGYTPKLRLRVLEVLLRRPDGPKAALDALASRRILPQDVPLTARRRLLEHPTKEVRTRAERLFTDLVNPDRNRVVVSYEAALRLKGDPARGLRVFARTCAVCHRLGLVGQAVGPDLAADRAKPPEWFLPAIFDPSRAVEAQYLNYTALTRDGKLFSGVLAEEGGNSITLIGPTGERHVLLRANLDELASTGKSFMPDGLEKELTPQDTADVIAHLKHAGAARKVVEHNNPEVVKPGGDGVLHLRGGNCEVFGNGLIPDERGSLVRWTSPDDRAVWTFEVSQPGRYAVWLDWSCEDASAERAYVIKVDGQTVRGKVAATGGRDNYRHAKVGEVRLEAGVGQLTFRAGEKIGKGKDLIDLKGVVLKPIPTQKPPGGIRTSKP